MIAIFNVKKIGVDDVVNRNTLAWRIMLAREDKGLKQNELVDKLRSRPYEIDLSYPGYSKIESGATRNPKHEILIALSEILEISLDELIAGKEPRKEETVHFFSEVAEEVAEIADELDEENRSFLLTIARHLQKLDQEQRDSDEMIIALLSSNLPHLPNGEQRKTRSAIDQLTRHRRPRIG